jgi:peptidyl-prolyl cis-trans isomerase D
MLTQLRKSMPLILWILIIAFVATIVFSWGMGGFSEKTKPGIVGYIEGKEVTKDFYDKMIEQEMETQERNTGVRPEEGTERETLSKVWNSLIEETLIAKEIERRGLTVSDSEIVGAMLNSPFDFVQSSEYFQTDGSFDRNKYLSFLRDPRNREQVIFWEQSYRQTLLKQKLIFQVISTVQATSYELRARFEERNVMGQAKYAMFAVDSMKVDSSEISKQKIEEYYYEHLKDYRVPEKRRIIFAKIDNIASMEDSADVRNLAQEIKQRLNKGEDFGALAFEHSDHHTAPDSGYLGWMPKLRLEFTSDSLVWLTKVGHYVGPFETRYGIHFYLVMDRGKREGELQSELRILQLKFLPSSDTKDMIANRMESFSQDIKKADFVQTAKAYDLEVDTSGYFEEGEFIPGIGKIRSAVDYAFNNPLGSTSMNYPLRNGWLVFKLIEIQPAHNRSLEEVQSEIFYTLWNEKKKDLAITKCKEFLQGLNDKTNWEKAAQEKGIPVFETENEFRFNDYVKNVGRDLAFTSVLLRSEVGQLNGPIAGENGCYLIEITHKTPIDTVVFEEGKLENLQKLNQSKQEMAYKDWLSDLKNKAKIKDLRYLYYLRL